MSHSLENIKLKILNKGISETEEEICSLMVTAHPSAFLSVTLCDLLLDLNKVQLPWCYSILSAPVNSISSFLGTWTPLTSPTEPHSSISLF